MNEPSIIIDALVAPLMYPLDPSRRVFVLFLVSSALMVVLFNVIRARRTERAVSVPLSRLFSRALWFNASTWLDVRSLFFNSAIKATLITPYIVGKMVVVLAVSGFLYEHVGPSPIVFSNHALIVVLFSAAVFVAEDFSRFFQHYLMHRVPALWAIHKVHHQAEVLTPLTLYRIHPIELLLSGWRSALVLGVVTGIFVYAFPGQISALEILGVDVFGFLFNAMGANLRHSPFPVSFGALSHVFISPVMHQMHHSRDQRHHNKNFGSCLSIWDKAFGSFFAQEPDCELQFGCKDKSRHTLTELYLTPLLFGRRLKWGLRSEYQSKRMGNRV